MDLYQALQGILDKVNDSATDAKYRRDTQEMLVVVLENQTRLAESMLILGGILKGILSKNISVQVFPKKSDTQH